MTGQIGETPNTLGRCPATGVFYFNGGTNYSFLKATMDSDRQTLTQGLNFSQETRPKSKFFSLLIYAGYPIA